MSDIKILVMQIDVVYPHPNADNLDIIKFGAYQVCAPRGEYHLGDTVAHFPPDILIPPQVADNLGVTSYLKGAIYPGDSKKTKCRVGAVRLRGVPSYGFVCPIDAAVGDDLTSKFSGFKYEPPDPRWWRLEMLAPENTKFHTYTKIKNFRSYSQAIPEGTPVRVTEKIHGTNSRMGLVDNTFMCGSHRYNLRKKAQNDKTSLYWTHLDSNMQDMLRCIALRGKDVIAFGEIYGSGIQFMDYGVQGAGGYSLYDISVNGVYLDWDQVVYYATRFCVPLVPTLYTGSFYAELVNHTVDGATVVGDNIRIRSGFKGREGVVITPLKEQFSEVLGDRMILKAVSVDYLSNRKSDSH